MTKTLTQDFQNRTLVLFLRGRDKKKEREREKELCLHIALLVRQAKMEKIFLRVIA